MRCGAIRRACLAFAGLVFVASAADGQRQRRFSIDGIVGRSDVRTQRQYDFTNMYATEAVLAFPWANTSPTGPAARIELGTAHAGPVAMVGSLSWFRVVKDGERLQYRSLGLGLRLR